ncbi:MAG: RHS repeat-associated core domain-containing protein [Chloroflexota bacterium]
MVGIGFVGAVTSQAVNSYTWDRANRLLSMGGASYKYDGLNNRVQQTAGANITKYLLDLQPGLAVVLSETTGANVIRNVYSPRGIHAHKDAGGAWEWMVQDGLGSVRGVVDNNVGVLESRNYDPYGTGFSATGSSQMVYGFTGEPMDDNGLLYLRARYYNPTAGVFTALDPFEGIEDEPMSLNGYSWVEGNVPNATDPSGQFLQLSTLNTWELAAVLSGGLCNASLVMSLVAEEVPTDPCDKRKKDMLRLLQDIAQRVDQLLKDFCDLWEVSQGQVIVPRRGCVNQGTWESHLRTLREKQRALRKPYNGFFDVDNCPDPDNKVRDTVDGWLAIDGESLLPEREAKRRGIQQPIPPQPTLEFDVTAAPCPGLEIFGACVPLILS